MRLLFIVSVAATLGYTLSVVINSSVSAATLVGFGIDVSLSDRLDMVSSEWLGLSASYLPLYLLLKATVFLVLHRVLANVTVSVIARYAYFCMAGALSLMALYAVLDAAMGLSGVLVASSRTLGGLLSHSATGIVSGAVFVYLSQRRAP